MLFLFEQIEKVCYGDLVILVLEDVVVLCGNYLFGKVLSVNGEVLNEEVENILLQKIKLDVLFIYVFECEEIIDVFEIGIKLIDFMLIIGIG